MRYLILLIVITVIEIGCAKKGSMLCDDLDKVCLDLGEASYGLRNVQGDQLYEVIYFVDRTGFVGGGGVVKQFGFKGETLAWSPEMQREEIPTFAGREEWVKRMLKEGRRKYKKTAK